VGGAARAVDVSRQSGCGVSPRRRSGGPTPGPSLRPRPTVFEHSPVAAVEFDLAVHRPPRGVLQARGVCAHTRARRWRGARRRGGRRQPAAAVENGSRSPRPAPGRAGCRRRAAGGGSPPPGRALLSSLDSGGIQPTRPLCDERCIGSPTSLPRASCVLEPPSRPTSSSGVKGMGGRSSAGMWGLP
jgi:hypothetical protein